MESHAAIAKQRRPPPPTTGAGEWQPRSRAPCSDTHPTDGDGSSKSASTTNVFTRIKSFAELFGPHAELANVAARFEAEKISPYWP